MNEDKPEWYSRARKAPFSDEKFTSEMKKNVHRSVIFTDSKPQRRKYLQVGWAGGVMLLIILIAFQLPFGREELQRAGTIPPGTEETVRAQGVTDEGRLRVIAVGQEKITTLGAPSCFGIETDRSFTGNYSVQFSTNQVTNEVTTLEDLTFIQPTTAPVEMIRLPFQDADVFILAPQYRDCHGIQIYAFAVEHDTGRAVQLRFQDESLVSYFSYYRPGTVPEVKENRLVLQSTEGPGGEGSPDYVSERMYQLDLRQNALVLGLRKTGTF
ncbi:MAG: hypothetical protein LKI04_24810 [Paenibacillus lautus]|jgi:hypothetical protein|uniref:hypothetical protein n=1 Tax=Paenibacillus lautus TaxID=1401 RepID=UPI0026EAC5A0|nr:hypothetical protein [Paenibacillus lautus]MCI1777235.1 hypothetical protein [Paenibacillus lautus]